MLTDKKVTIPGGSFTSTTGNPMLACSIGANTGHLYVLERSMFFIDKPAINIPYDHIEVVEFLRHSQITSNRNFDMDVRLKVKACVRGVRNHRLAYGTGLYVCLWMCRAASQYIWEAARSRT